jgi:hypothetical protein
VLQAAAAAEPKLTLLFTQLVQQLPAWSISEYMMDVCNLPLLIPSPISIHLCDW